MDSSAVAGTTAMPPKTASTDAPLGDGKNLMKTASELTRWKGTTAEIDRRKSAEMAKIRKFEIEEMPDLTNFGFNRDSQRGSIPHLGQGFDVLA
jgi:hypothetical protein